MLAFTGLIYNFWHRNQQPSLETGTVLHHAESFIFLNRTAYECCTFSVQTLGLFNCRRERQLRVASKSFLCISDPQILRLAFRLVRIMCMYEGMKCSLGSQKKQKNTEVLQLSRNGQGNTAKGAQNHQVHKGKIWNRYTSYANLSLSVECKQPKRETANPAAQELLDEHLICALLDEHCVPLVSHTDLAELSLLCLRNQFHPTLLQDSKFRKN